MGRGRGFGNDGDERVREARAQPSFQGNGWGPPEWISLLAGPSLGCTYEN